VKIPQECFICPAGFSVFIVQQSVSGKSAITDHSCSSAHEISPFSGKIHQFPVRGRKRFVKSSRVFVQTKKSFVQKIKKHADVFPTPQRK
jgi:hypothetical protein